MFKAWRYVRWLTLLVSLIVEAAVYWAAGPTHDFLQKATYAWTWEWMGAVAASLAWLYFEVALHSFRNAKRVRDALIDADDRLEYETGLHWLALRRNIREHRAAWYCIWVPVWFAAVSALFLFGWLVYAAASLPQTLARSSGVPLLIDGLAGFRALVRGDTWLTLVIFVVPLVAWVVLHERYHYLRKMKKSGLATRSTHLGQWAAFAVFMYAVLSTRWFDWLYPLYGFLPHNGIALAGFLPLGIISPLFFVPHIAEWISTRYALIVDSKSLDGGLVILTGVMDKNSERITLERVVDAKLSQRWWKRPLRAGDITLIETGGDREGRSFTDVWDPQALVSAILICIRNRHRRQSGTD